MLKPLTRRRNAPNLRIASAARSHFNQLCALETTSQWKKFMQEYDVALKLLLQQSAELTIRELTGTKIVKWLNVELPKVQNLRLDLLGEAVSGSLFQLELQSSNDPNMPLRMAEYSYGVYRLVGKFPLQILLYIGEAPLRMESEFRGPYQWF